MKIDRKKLSICIPVYKRSIFLPLLINSIPNNIDIYVSDNGGLVAPNVKSLDLNIKAPKLDVVVGPFENWNCAIRMSDSEWVLIPGDDDLYYDFSFSDVIFPSIEKYEKAKMIIFGHETINIAGDITGSWLPEGDGFFNKGESFNFFKYGVNARMPSILFNRKALLEEGGFDESFLITAGDSELIQRFAINHPVAIVKKSISKYRIWEGNDTTIYTRDSRWYDEICLWMDKLYINLINKPDVINKYRICFLQHDIKLQNITSAVNRFDNVDEVVKYLNQKPYPWLARPVTHLRFFRALISNFITK